MSQHSHLPPSTDTGLSAVEAALYALDQTGELFAMTLRDTLDQVLDGGRTGRWEYTQLHKTEKTYTGTLVEINLQRAFNFDDGDATDYRIAGHEVDCKHSQRIGGWELPPEVVGRLCLLVWTSDRESAWRAGLIRADEIRLREVRNRDAKRRLTQEAMGEVRWLWPDHGRLPENLLLHLAPATCTRIMTATATRGRNHGQARVNELFRLVQGRIIRRAVLATVAQQDDPMKRARGNGGARTHLQPEGVVVLGHQDNDPVIARALGLPVPAKGEFISVRVVKVSEQADRRAALIDGQWWAVARDGEPVVPAPVIPRGSAAD